MTSEYLQRQMEERQQALMENERLRKRAVSDEMNRIKNLDASSCYCDEVKAEDYRRDKCSEIKSESFDIYFQVFINLFFLNLFILTYLTFYYC